MKAYAIAFTDGRGTPKKLVNIPFYSSPSEAKAEAKRRRKEAEGNGYKTYGRSWDYVAVTITPLR